MLVADWRAECEGRRPFAAAAVPFLRPEPFGAQRSRHRRERAHHGEVLAAAGAGALAVRQVHRLSRRADHVSLSAAQGSGERRRAARKYPAMHLGRRDHACNVEPGVRGALQDAAARRLRDHRDCNNGHHELAPRRAADRFVRIAGAGPRRAYRRSFVAGRRSLRRRRGTDRARSEPDEGLSQQAGGDRGCAKKGVVPHGRSREVGPVRLPDDHRTHQGAHHPRGPEHRAGRDRGSRPPTSAT